MVLAPRNSPKQRAWSTPAHVDRSTNARRLWQAAKLRVRRAIPHFTLPYMNHPKTTEDAQGIHAPPKGKESPLMGATPLVPRDAWQTLPQQLVRPVLPEIDPENVYALHPAYRGIPLAHIRQIWPMLGIKAFKAYRTLWVDPPKTALPATYDIILKDLGLTSCCTHLFGVYPSVNPKGPNPVARLAGYDMRHRRAVAIFPTHGAIWAAHCANLPRLQPPPSPVPMQTVRTPAEHGKDAATALQLPVVPIQIPYPDQFFGLQVFIYSRDRHSFVQYMLPFPGMRPYQYTPIQNAMRASNVEALAELLAKWWDMDRLLRIARNVFGCYHNMEVLGIVDDEAWECLQFAWDSLRAGMALRDLMDKKTAAILADCEAAFNAQYQ